MRIAILIGVFIMGFVSMGQAIQGNHFYNELQTQELKIWYEEGKNMIVVDARSKLYYDGTLLPQAKWLPYDATSLEIQEALPSKNALVVIYCWSPQCPASHYLADRLKDEGYTNLYKYSAGLQNWQELGYPISKS